MVRPWAVKGIALLLLFSILAACASTQAVPSVTGVEPKQENAKDFQPYREASVPKLEDLITRPGFRRYTSQKPYLLGYSQDGSYLATIVYEKKANAYRIDIFHVGNNLPADTIYAPIVRGRAENERSTEMEMLQATQETLDWGYRIKVPVVPQETPIHHPIRTSGDKTWSLYVKQEDTGISFKVEGEGERWQIHHHPLKEGERIRPQWLVSSFPHSNQGHWSMIVATYRVEQGLTVNVQSVDVEKLSPDWSEAKLESRVRKRLGEGAQIVYRGRLTVKGPDSILAVLNPEEEAVGVDGVRYRGTVRRFILMDGNGTIYFRGNAAGLVAEEQVRIDPSIPKDENIQFRLMVREKETGDGQKRRLLTIDQINGDGILERTYELQWMAEQGRFKRIPSKG